MGIFKRKSGPADQGKLQEERYKLLGRELQIAVENEIRRNFGRRRGLRLF